MVLTVACRQAVQLKCFCRSNGKWLLEQKEQTQGGWKYELHFTQGQLERKCSSLSRDPRVEAIRMQALHLWRSDWIELRSRLWSELTICRHATARSVDMHTKHAEKNSALPQLTFSHFHHPRLPVSFFSEASSYSWIISGIWRMEVLFVNYYYKIWLEPAPHWEPILAACKPAL